jgi:GT2 family glycosyltransferase
MRERDKRIHVSRFTFHALVNNDTSTPDLSIIIVNWNVRDLLAACLRSLQSQPGAVEALQVIVVDSHSADDSVAMVRRDFPGWN